MDNLTSRVISFIRFPMIAAVVAIHCNFIIVNPELESRYLFSILFSITLKLIWVSVPIFFFISGLLFFKEGTFNISLYKSKLRKRFYTIFIPYIIWNIIYFCIVCLQQFFKPDLLLLLHKRIIDFNWTDYLWIFWDIRQISHLPDDQPACLVGVFWFIQCLFVTSLLSPVIYKIIKFTRHFFLLIFIALCFIDFKIDIPGINNVGIAYFCLGAYVSIMRINFVNYLRRIPIFISIITVFICSFSVFIENEYLDFLFTMLLQVGVFSLITYLINKDYCHENTLLTSSVFFIFAVHRLFTAPLMHIADKVVSYINNDILLYIYYLLTITTAILLSITLFWVMNKYMPKVTGILNGRR